MKMILHWVLKNSLLCRQVAHILNNIYITSYQILPGNIVSVEIKREKTSHIFPFVEPWSKPDSDITGFIQSSSLPFLFLHVFHAVIIQRKEVDCPAMPKACTCTQDSKGPPGPTGPPVSHTNIQQGFCKGCTMDWNVIQLAIRTSVMSGSHLKASHWSVVGLQECNWKSSLTVF